MKKPYISFIILRHREKTSNNTSIPPFTTNASCCGIQLIWTIESFHTSPFEIVVRGSMVHSKIAFFSRWKAKVGILRDYYGGAESYSFTYTHLGFIHLLWLLALAPSYFSTVPSKPHPEPISMEDGETPVWYWPTGWTINLQLWEREAPESRIFRMMMVNQKGTTEIFVVQRGSHASCSRTVR
jgi:hypothetical protein